MSVLQAVPIHQFPTVATITVLGGFEKNDEKVKIGKMANEVNILAQTLKLEMLTVTRCQKYNCTYIV